MNSNVTRAPWQQFKIQLRKTWSALTDEDLDAISQGKDDLVRVVQYRCGGKQDVATTSPSRVERDVPTRQFPSETDPLGIRAEIKWR